MQEGFFFVKVNFKDQGKKFQFSTREETSDLPYTSPPSKQFPEENGTRAIELGKKSENFLHQTHCSFTNGEKVFSEIPKN